jgi:acetyl-CoA acyltransferase
MIAAQWGFDRAAVDEFSLGSHEKAAAAQGSGAFGDQIVAIKDQDGNPVLKDEGIRRGTTIEKMAELKPAFKEDGVIHAGNSSPISDGSAALLFMSVDKAKSLGLKPIAEAEAEGEVSGTPGAVHIRAVVAAKWQQTRLNSSARFQAVLPRARYAPRSADIASSPSRSS